MKKLTLLLLSLLALLAGCAQGTTELAPPDIRYGEDVCVECNMIISDERFASSIAYEVGPGRYETAAFDDIADMLDYAVKHPEQPPVAWYVHDYESKEWIDATAASYVVTDQVVTPMASGMLAFSNPQRADVMAYTLGLQVLDWNTVRARHAVGEIGVGAMGGMHGGGMAGAPAEMGGDAMAGDPHAAMSSDEVVLGEADVAGYKLQLVSHGPLHAGYNSVMAHLTDPEGQPVSGAEMTYTPMMSMVDGMDHGAPVEQPLEELPGMYHGAVGFTMPGGPDLGSWTLGVNFADPVSGATGAATFDLDVAPSKLTGSFEAPDGSKIFVMAVDPIEPPTGKQPFEVFVAQKKSMADWPALDGLSLEIEPGMPTMGHGSPGNENPVAAGGGHYTGLVNFTMRGPWEVVITVGGKDGALGEVVLEYTVP